MSLSRHRVTPRFVETLPEHPGGTQAEAELSTLCAASARPHGGVPVRPRASVSQRQPSPIPADPPGRFACERLTETENPMIHKASPDISLALWMVTTKLSSSGTIATNVLN